MRQTRFRLGILRNDRLKHGGLKLGGLRLGGLGPETAGRGRDGASRPAGRGAVPALLAVTAAAAAVLALSAGPAAAGSGFGQLIVNPGAAAPGQSVSVLGTCPTNGQKFEGVVSSAFVGGFASVQQGSENFTGTAVIKSGMAPGKYTVTAECGDGSPYVDITVESASGTLPTPTSSTTWKPTTAPSQTAHSMAPTPTSSKAGGMTGTKTGTSAKPSSTASSSGGGIGIYGVPTAHGSSLAVTPAPAVTSTGIIRVGLAGDNNTSVLSMTNVSIFAAVLAAAGGTGFFLIRRRRASSHTEG